MGNAPSALHQAVLSGDLARCRVAVQEHPSEIDNAEPGNGWTGLHIASAKGYDYIVRELLARGANPHVADKAGRTALHLAVAEGYTSVVKDLLRNGADPLTRDQENKTSLDVALEKQHTAVISLLSDALAGRGVLTPTGSPAGWQARAAQQAGVVVAPPAAAVGRLSAPDVSQLNNSEPQLQPAGAYPHVPAPLTAADTDWLYDLPVPPTGSINPHAAPLPAGQAAAGSGGQQQQQQLPDYYSYIRPLPPAMPSASGGAPDIPLYPMLPSAAAQPPQAAGAYAPQQPQQQQKQLQQQWRPPQPPPVVLQPHPISVDETDPGVGYGKQQQAPGAADDEDDDDWGTSAVDDDWGTARSAVARRPTAASSGRDVSRAGPDLGAAVSGASKVVGAVANTAVAGARHLLTGLLPRPPTKGGADSSLSPQHYSNMPGATTAGPAGRTYSYEELAQATGGFGAANKLGSGGYGPVYRGVLDGVPVAVKLLDPGGVSRQGPKEFAAEVAILSRLHHPHIVLLMGSCPERCALVYELLDYGSLEQHLFSPTYPDLQWQDRLRVACEVVSALVFLHSAPEPIIHMDLKPANLLLSRSLVCKVGDVGLSRFMPSVKSEVAAGAVESTVLDSRLVGTPSYTDPEYLRTGRFGPKSDVYSLGIILLQMLTGIEAGRVVSVVEAALARCQSDPASFSTIIDSRSGSWPITEAASFAHLAMRCVELSRTNRPELRSEVLPALLQLSERGQLYDTRALKRGASLSISNQPPSVFICPITQDVMVDPVFAADGYTYEREAIAGWLQYHDTSPMTNLPLSNMSLTPNLALRSAIKDWQDKQQQGPGG